MDLMVERCAGVDIGKDEVVACVRTPAPSGKGRRKQTRTFSSFTSQLEAMADWFASEGVTEVVMEATGSYWKSPWYVLGERGFDLKLVNAHHVKILPGRKSDVADAEWLAELLEHGLLRSSFVPPAEIRQLRDRPVTANGSSRSTPRSASGSKRPSKTPGSSSAPSPQTCWACPAGPCSKPSLPANATPKSWPSWPKGYCARRSPNCAKLCEAASRTTMP